MCVLTLPAWFSHFSSNSLALPLYSPRRVSISSTLYLHSSSINMALLWTLSTGYFKLFSLIFKANLWRFLAFCRRQSRPRLGQWSDFASYSFGICSHKSHTAFGQSLVSPGCAAAWSGLRFETGVQLSNCCFTRYLSVVRSNCFLTIYIGAHG